MPQMLSFKGWMAENGVKQNELAELLGLSTQMINLKVNGKRGWSLEQVGKICAHYHVSADVFLPAELRYSNKYEVDT